MMKRFGMILLMEEILHHLTRMKPRKKWDIYHINIIFAINNSNITSKCIMIKKNYDGWKFP